MTFQELESNVRRWSKERGIYDHSTAQAQLLKAVSEMGELCDAEAKGDEHGKIDAVGDVLVCLVNYCALAGIDIESAMAQAWDEIKDRSGHMVEGGVFVKDEPLVPTADIMFNRGYEHALNDMRDWLYDAMEPEK